MSEAETDDPFGLIINFDENSPERVKHAYQATVTYYKDHKDEINRLIGSDLWDGRRFLIESAGKAFLGGKISFQDTEALRRAVQLSGKDS